MGFSLFLATLRQFKIRISAYSVFSTVDRSRQESLRVTSRYVEMKKARWVFPQNESKGKKSPRIVYLDDETLAQVLQLTDVLLLTAEEAKHLVSDRGAEAATALRAFGPPVVVLKAGADGCYVATKDVNIHHPGFDVEVIDTVGAGDSFVAAFIAPKPGN